MSLRPEGGTRPAHTLLVATVGGTPEVIAVALGHWRPARALFFVSSESARQVRQAVDLVAERYDFHLPPGADDVVTLPGAEDLTSAIRCIREHGARIEDWLRRGPEYRVVVDFTAGTKAMAAALALAARQWACTVSYIGGEDRTKDGVGVVVSGREKVLRTDNPWNALGYQAVEEAVLLCDRHAYAAAATLLGGVEKRIAEKRARQELTALRFLCELLDAWERFQPGTALEKLSAVAAKQNDLAAALGRERADTVLRELADARDHLQALTSSQPGWAHVRELLANAGRRAEEERWDDAVARLYRATEALAQVRLAEVWEIADTGKVPVERVPEPLQDQWASRSERGVLKLGLQDAYRLLEQLGDAVGAEFRAHGLLQEGDKPTPLSSRNQSILAHGFQPSSRKTFEALQRPALAMLRVAGIDAALPRLPQLGSDR